MGKGGYGTEGVEGCGVREGGAAGGFDGLLPLACFISLSDTNRTCLQPDTTQPPGPSGVDGAYLLYNEYIAYDVAQIRLRYLFRVEMK